jgi:hypothetical protein
MNNTEEPDVYFLLRKLLTNERLTSTTAHAWISEDDRWGELVFSLLSGVAPNLPERQVRSLIRKLSQSGIS